MYKELFQGAFSRELFQSAGSGNFFKELFLGAFSRSFFLGAVSGSCFRELFLELFQRLNGSPFNGDFVKCNYEFYVKEKEKK